MTSTQHGFSRVSTRHLSCVKLAAMNHSLRAGEKKSASRPERRHDRRLQYFLLLHLHGLDVDVVI